MAKIRSLKTIKTKYGRAGGKESFDFDPSTAKKSKDGFWRDANSNILRVSASDIERHAYCPLSWELAKQGNTGQGEAEMGKTKHAGNT